MKNRPLASWRRPRLAAPLALAAALALSGCDLVVMNPAGDVARQQADLILWSTALMLLIIIPVMALTVLFAWKYRATNKDAEYAPDWDHSTGLELVIWAAPLMIIIALGALTWVSTHLLDPYRPLGRLAPAKPLAANDRPLEIQVVSLDWKWLFIYPEQGVATVNELVLPLNRQVRFRMTSSSVMNTFWVPAMAGMIYTMPGMETKLHAVLDKPGRYEGRSGNYSGAGFSGMTFWTYAVDDAGFTRWASQTRAAQARLTDANYLKLEQPSENVQPIRFGGVQNDLFRRITQMCVKPGVPCMSDVMADDMAEPGSHAPVNDRPPVDAPKGALRKDPNEKGSAPHLTAPRGPAEGSTERGAQSNRNMTRLEPVRRPGVTVTAQG
ncbi:ubiquinol oxidase subunit II [Sphingomonas sp. HHU CXW]|uniref:Ubiquinol oxidase polypeptide II n=1 Tax=Sphingomonas hominis TaxID=2741495 RepID=A0ABX2JJM4_9SPHN|nr:ubiquinol oxidase subunit II [Sphingomonas hominis]NTS65670.1 ubiquinol oxidase subunit II [Sphingomonas hominis]